MYTPDRLKDIHRVLCEDNGLAALCTQNGWIDNASLWSEAETGRDGNDLVSVHFEEVITKGGGCVAKRQPCWGRVCIDWQAAGSRVRVLQG